MAVSVTLVLTALFACSRAANVTVFETSSLTVVLQNNSADSLDLVLTRGNTTSTIVELGRNAGAVASSSNSSGTINVVFENSTTLAITSTSVSGNWTGHVFTFTWIGLNTTVLEDCVALGSLHWYGGPQQKRQYWPIERLVLSEYSYVTKETDNCAIAERYWLNSEGIFYYVDQKVPLFIDQNSKESGSLCFTASVESPYSTTRTRNVLIYSIGIFDDAREAHEYAVSAYLNKPTGTPNQMMVTYPIWSTWARYKRLINDSVVMEFAEEILTFGFSNQSQYEIDDLWETCYGSEVVDVLKFANMSSTIATLQDIGFRVTMWAHPFINLNCLPYFTTATTNGYLVANENGSVVTSWWNDNGTSGSYIDFTKETARTWYTTRLQTLQTNISVDGYKFDAGESSWSPTVPVLEGDIEEQPHLITSEYVRAVSAFGDLTEVRSGFMTQDLPIFVRMVDKDSYWGFSNGLSTVITTTLQMNMNGYPFVLPDMVGGNGYNGAPSKELFIRWLQATTFMPSIQFSYVPWDYDMETVNISLKFVALHEEYAPLIIEAFNKSVTDGSPVNPPIWWIAPNDTEAQAVWDQYLLGETIIVAPVVLENTVTRSVYLPEGTWMEQGNSSALVEGPVWLIDYPAPLDVLPFFVLVPSSQGAIMASITLLLITLIANVFVNYE